MHLSLESNFPGFIGARGVEETNGDVMSPRLIMVIGFQGCNWNLQV